MSRRKYPTVGPWETESTERTFLLAGKKCPKCDHIFGKKETYWRRETEVNWFRGDDEVEYMCSDCFRKREKEEGLR